MSCVLLTILDGESDETRDELYDPICLLDALLKPQHMHTHPTPRIRERLLAREPHALPIVRDSGDLSAAEEERVDGVDELAVGGRVVLRRAEQLTEARERARQSGDGLVGRLFFAARGGLLGPGGGHGRGGRGVGAREARGVVLLLDGGG